MDAAQVKSKLKELYAAFASMPEALLDYTISEAVVRTVPAGTVMFDEANACQAFPMLLSGSIRVVKNAPSGRELQLYRVVPGESCILSSSCMLGSAPYTARGIAESDVTLVGLPEPVFNRLLAEHPPFRNYVFGLFAERITDLLELVEAVAFQRLDQRLAALLLGKGKVVRTTHQALADELGSVREIVSRLLKSFAEQGMVSVGREQIEIVDAAKLRRVASPA